MQPIGITREAWRFITNADHRAVAKLKLGRGAHQTTLVTGLDRYPEIFSACAEHLADVAAPRLLSFGCSTGEEVVTLRAYFPDARITGLEINDRSLARCRARRLDRRVRFDKSDGDALARNGPYDAIFCMAVLQRTPHVVEQQGLTDISKIYPFARFDEQLRRFDQQLAPGGLMIVEHTQYRFADAAVAAGYEVLPLDLGRYPTSQKFDRDGRLIRGETPREAVFVKRGARPG